MLRPPGWQTLWRQTLREVKHFYALQIDRTVGASASSWAGSGPNAVCKGSADALETGDWPVLKEARALGLGHCLTVPALASRGQCVPRLNRALAENHCWGKAGWIHSPPGRLPTHNWDSGIALGCTPVLGPSQPVTPKASWVHGVLAPWEPGHLAHTHSSPAGHKENSTHHHPPASPRPLHPCTETHCLPPARRGCPAEPAVDSGPPLGAGFCTKGFISQITWWLGCPVRPGVQPCTSSLLFLGAASHPDEPREQRRQQVQTRPPRVGHIPSTLVASKNKKRNRVSGTSPFTSARERRAPHIKAQRRRPPGAGRR